MIKLKSEGKISKKKDKKLKSKALIRPKKGMRYFVSFHRIVRYGVDSFLRNAWLSMAATIVMVITLLIVFTTFIAQNVMNSTISELGDKVDMSIYLKTDTSADVGDALVKEVEQLSSVKSATFISSDEAKQSIAEANSDNADVLEAIKEATNMTPATLRVVVKDINDTSELENFVDNDELVKTYINSDYEPSFAGDRRNTIKSIGNVVNFIQEAGILAGSVFVIISSLIIFNTIRMAIFNRKEEIQMMKLIGADKSFIRGPFLIEAVLYGLIAAVVASGIGIFTVYKVAPVLTNYQITVQPTLDMIVRYGWLIVLCMMGAGTIIGIFSSLLATRKYLKV